MEGSPRGVEANVLYCDIVVSEFDLQSRNYVLFQTNEKGMNLIISQVR